MRFVDSYFYRPSAFQKLLSLLLLPIACLYGMASFLRRKLSKYHDFHIPIISVGNLIAGGSGKTPFIIESAKALREHFPQAHIAIISRGYKRKSKGFVVVSLKGEIQALQADSGDEPYLIARELRTHKVSVIVDKNRIQAINKAKELGVEIILLDDGFRFNFNKLNIVLQPLLEPYFALPLPSGIYRELPSAIKDADLLVREGVEYTREVSIEAPSERMLLLTAIANPSRLDAFLPESVVGKITLSDHADFDIEDLERELEAHNATSLLVTSKDEVKLLESNLPLSVMRLHLNVQQNVLDSIINYTKENINGQ